MAVVSVTAIAALERLATQLTKEARLWRARPGRLFGSALFHVIVKDE